MEMIKGHQEDPKRGGLFDRRYRFTVKYVVPFDRLDEFVEAVKPFSTMVYNKGFKYHQAAQTKNQARRIRGIQRFLFDYKWIRIGPLYRKIRKMGYSHSYKTLQRDICAIGRPRPYRDANGQRWQARQHHVYTAEEPRCQIS